MSGKRVICGNHGEGRWSWRRRSKRITAQATATLSEWAEPCMGMRRVESARERSSVETPVVSLPRISAAGCVRSWSQIGFPSTAEEAMIFRPTCLRRLSEALGDSSGTMGTFNMEPVEARTVERE